MPEVRCPKCGERGPFPLLQEEDEDGYTFVLGMAAILSDTVFHAAPTPRAAYETLQVMQQILGTRFRLAADDNPFDRSVNKTKKRDRPAEPGYQ